MKKTLSFILSLIMVLGVITSVPLTVNAASVDDLTFELNEDGKSYSVTGWNEEPNGKIIIPDTHNSLPVTNIYEFAFWGSHNLTSIIIPNSVISIGHNAFSDCGNLTSISIPDSVTSISSTAFNNTGYYKDVSNWDEGVLYIGNHLIETTSDISNSYKIKNGTKTIADQAFFNCENLTSVTIPDSVISIGKLAFYDCQSLTSIIIPNSVTIIHDSAFEGCISLTSIEVSSKNLNYASNNGVLFNKEKTILVKYPTGRAETTYIIPNGVICIGDSSFYDCQNLTSVILPNSVTSIGNYSFYDCTSLTTITIPGSVTSIGYSAFEDCTSLTSITISDSVTTIGEKAFYCTGYHNNDSNWKKGVLYIGEHLIETRSDVNGFYEIKTGTKTIADYAFRNRRNLTAITIPDSVTNIGEEAFCACGGLTSVTIPNSVTNIERCAFYNCINLTSVIIPDSVTSIGSCAFGYYMYGKKQMMQELMISKSMVQKGQLLKPMPMKTVFNLLT